MERNDLFYDLKVGDILNATAFRWNEKKNHLLEVMLGIDPTINCVVEENELSIYKLSNTRSSSIIDLLLNISLNYMVKDIDYKTNKIFLSRKLLAEQTLNQLFNKGDFIKATITKTLAVGCYADYNGINCFCPKSEMSYIRGCASYQIFTVGQEMPFIFLNWNSIKDTLLVSYKDLFESLKDNRLYSIGDIIPVTIVERLPESYDYTSQKAYSCIVSPIYFGVIQMPLDERPFFGKKVNMYVSSISDFKINGVLEES